MKTAKTSINLRKVFRDSLRMYFAPLIGAYSAVVAETKRVDKEHAKHHAHSNSVKSA